MSPEQHRANNKQPSHYIQCRSRTIQTWMDRQRPTSRTTRNTNNQQPTELTMNYNLPQNHKYNNQFAGPTAHRTNT
eukprot:5796515-Amphidinium_carterae.3